MIPETAIYPLKVLWETAEEICAESQFVHVPGMSYHTEVESIQRFYQAWSAPSWPRGVQTQEELVMYFLIRDSVNFCFWYGRPSIRPNGSNSGKLAEVLSDCFEKVKRGHLFYETVIFVFGQKLKRERFPLIDERIACLQELIHYKNRMRLLQCQSPQSILQVMIECYPRYTADMFLKRASLFIGEIYKACCPETDEHFWETEIWDFPVPADYHLPNILRSKGLIVYRGDLDSIVRSNIEIPKGSAMETEIRAATVHVCQTLSMLSRVPACILDDYLFSQRHEAQEKNPFHLTITTDY